MKVHGRCHCGAIQYEADVDPARVQVCHCSDCQQFSGAPYRVSVPAPRDAFTLTAGTPRVYVKTADSGNKRAQAFCADCGTALYSTQGEGPPQFYMLRVGALKQREALVPKKQIWAKSALPWTYHIDTLESVAGQT